MIKSIEKIFIVLVIVILAFGMVVTNYSYASEASISVTTAKVNENFIVTVKIPSDAISYEGKIDVIFENGSTLSSGNLKSSTGNTYPGNMSATFKATCAGVSTIKVKDLVIKGRDNNKINSKSELEQVFIVEANGNFTSSSIPTTPTTQQPTQQAATSNSDTSYTSTGDTVYALEKLNVRKSASTDSDKLGSLSKDASTKRIAVGSNGWDKIEFNGGTGYVMSKYLTTKKPEGATENTTTNNTVPEPKWTSTGDTVYSTKSLNVREGWGTSFKSIGGLTVGQKVKRIATGDNGWDKIEYEGQNAYVMSKYLTTSKDEAEKLVQELKEEKNEVSNNTISENVVQDTNTVDNTSTENTLSREEIYNTIVDEIGVIPQVGKSVVDYIYTFVVILGIILVSFVALKIKDKKEE